MTNTKNTTEKKDSSMDPNSKVNKWGQISEGVEGVHQSTVVKDLEVEKY